MWKICVKAVERTWKAFVEREAREENVYKWNRKYTEYSKENTGFCPVDHRIYTHWKKVIHKLSTKCG